jgi:hypothetical protein
MAKGRGRRYRERKRIIWREGVKERERDEREP